MAAAPAGLTSSVPARPGAGAATAATSTAERPPAPSSSTPRSDRPSRARCTARSHPAWRHARTLWASTGGGSRQYPRNLGRACQILQAEVQQQQIDPGRTGTEELAAPELFVLLQQLLVEATFHIEHGLGLLGTKL